MENQLNCPVCHKLKPKPQNKFCSMSCRNINTNKNADYTGRKAAIAKSVHLHHVKRTGELKDFNVTCHHCEKEFIVSEHELKYPMKEKYFCTLQCANSRDASYTQTEEFSIKMSKLTKALWQNEEYAAKLLAIPNKYNSKGELMIRKYFQEKYVTDEWNYGIGLRHKGIHLVRDLYSKKLKVCFEYDGIWHFKDIKNQLADKQFKDQLLEEWCLENDYRLIRIRDEIFMSDPTKYLQILDNLFYNDTTKQIIKIYDLNLIENQKLRERYLRYNAKRNIL